MASAPHGVVRALVASVRRAGTGVVGSAAQGSHRASSAISARAAPLGALGIAPSRLMSSEVPKKKWVEKDVGEYVTKMEDLVPHETVEMDDCMIQSLIPSEDEYDSADEKYDHSEMPTRVLYDTDYEANELPHSDDDTSEVTPVAEQDQMLGPEWIYDNKHHVYYNTLTKETLVRKSESNTLYEERRAKRALKAIVRKEEEFTDQEIATNVNSGFVHATNLYTNYDMHFTKHKYNWMDFGELNNVLHEADRRFFQESPKKNIHPWGPDIVKPMPEGDQEDRHTEEREKFLTKLKYKFHVAHFRRSNMTRTGRVFSHGALVIGGNGKGWASYGYGKGASTMDAERRAVDALRKNLVDVPILEGRTIFRNVVGRYGRTKVMINRMPRGNGVKGGKFMKSLCECLGINDVTTKIHGPRHPLHVAYAAFQGLGMTISTRELALRMGVNYYKMYEAGTEHEAAPTSEEIVRNTQQINTYISSAKKAYDHRNLAQQRLKTFGLKTPAPPRGKHNNWHLPIYDPKTEKPPPGKKMSQPKWTPAGLFEKENAAA